MSKRDPSCCERCGSVLVIFEEHPDGSRVYCACHCKAAADAPACHLCGKPLQVWDEWDNGEAIFIACPCVTGADASPSVPETKPATASRNCRNCGALMVRVGTRPDGSPIEAECPCLRPARSDRAKAVAGRGRRPAPMAHAAPAARPQSSGSKVVMAGAGVVALAAILAGWWAHESGPRPKEVPAEPVAHTGEGPAELVRPPPPLPPGGIEIKNDASGAVMLVTGSDPNAVFRAFCRHPQFNAALVPGTLGSTTPPDPDLLLGSAVLMDGASTPRQVMLKRDPTTRRWSIGDGKSAIVLTNPAAATGTPAP